MGEQFRTGQNGGTEVGRESRSVSGPWDLALARCRLWVVGQLLKRDRLRGGRDLPLLLPEQWDKRMALEEPKVRVPLDAREIDLKDRTLDLIDKFAVPDRLTLMGMVLGYGSGGIWRELRAHQLKAGHAEPEPEDRQERAVWKESQKRHVRRRMLHLSELFARRLNAAGEPVDEQTLARWEDLTARRAGAK